MAVIGFRNVDTAETTAEYEARVSAVERVMWEYGARLPETVAENRAYDRAIAALLGVHRAFGQWMALDAGKRGSYDTVMSARHHAIGCLVACGATEPAARRAVSLVTFRMA